MAKSKHANRVKGLTPELFQFRMKQDFYDTATDAMRAVGRMKWSAEDLASARALVYEKFNVSRAPDADAVWKQPIPDAKKKTPLDEIIYKIRRGDYKDRGYAERGIRRYSERLTPAQVQKAEKAADDYFAAKAAEKSRAKASDDIPKAKPQGGGAKASAMSEGELGEAMNAIAGHVASQGPKGGLFDADSAGPRGSARGHSIAELRETVDSLQRVFEFACAKEKENARHRPYADAIQGALTKASLALAAALDPAAALASLTPPVRVKKALRGRGR